MGIYRHFPYTNFHEMNLDEIIKMMKTLTEEWLQYYTTWNEWRNETNTAFEELRQFVIDSFDNLNVTQAVSDKIDEMIEDGTFDNILGKFFEHFTKDYYFSSNYVTIDNLMDLSVDDTYALFDDYVTKGILSKSIIGYASTANTQVDDAEENTNSPIYMYSWIRRATRIHDFPLTVLNKKILLTNAVHGNEKIGVPVMLTMLKDYEVGENQYINWLFNSFNIDFVPVVNPFGYDLAIGTTMETVEDNIGRVNARGVDLNRNGNTAWYAIASGEGTYEYKGPKPYSEAESRALYNFIYTHNNDYSFYMDIHTERYSLSENIFGSLGCSSSYARSIFGNVIASLYNRFRETYGYDIVDNLAPTTGIAGGNSGVPMYSIDFYEVNGQTFTAALYECPRYNDGVIYPAKTQKWTVDIIVNFLYRFLHWQTEYRATRNTSYNVERLLNRALHNLAPIEPYSWEYGYHIETGVAYDTRDRITTKAPIILDGVSTYDFEISSITGTTFLISLALMQDDETLEGVWRTWSNKITIDSSALSAYPKAYITVRSEPSQFLITEEVNTSYIVTCFKRDN